MKAAAALARCSTMTIRPRRRLQIRPPRILRLQIRRLQPPPAADLDFAWANGVKAEAGEGEDASNLDWLKGTKVKDLDSLVKIARDNQKALRESGRVKIPGADAKPEEIAAFREAMGVPDKAEGYEIKLPEGLDGEKYEVDGKFLNPLRDVALAHNVRQSGVRRRSPMSSCATGRCGGAKPRPTTRPATRTLNRGAPRRR
jgi:hypothetical protein